jgi:hypothetical protein
LLNGYLNHDHSSGFKCTWTGVDKKAHCKWQLEWLKSTIDFCWMIGIFTPKPPREVLEVFPELRIYATKLDLIRDLLDYVKLETPPEVSEEERKKIKNKLAIRYGWLGKDMSVAELRKRLKRKIKEYKKSNQ